MVFGLWSGKEIGGSDGRNLWTASRHVVCLNKILDVPSIKQTALATRRCLRVLLKHLLPTMWQGGGWL